MNGTFFHFSFFSFAPGEHACVQMLNMPNPHVLAGLLLQAVKGNWSEWSTVADYFRGSIRSRCLSSLPGGYAELDLPASRCLILVLSSGQAPRHGERLSSLHDREDHCPFHVRRPARVADCGWRLQDHPEPLRRAEDGRETLRCRTICLHLLVVFGVSTFFTWLCFCTK